MRQFLNGILSGFIRLGSSTGPMILSGSGSPEGAVSAPVASTYHRTDGGSATTYYVKESGSGNTGWRAMPLAGGGGGSVTVVQASVDFGDLPGAYADVVTVSYPGATVGQKVIATLAADMSGGLSIDELEMDPLVVSARVSATDTIEVSVFSTSGPVTGIRNVNLIVG